MNENDELISAGEAAQLLNAVTELPENKCITRGEFDDLVASNTKYTLIVFPTPSDATVRIDGVKTKTVKVPPNRIVKVEVSKSGYITYTNSVAVTEDMKILNVFLYLLPAGAYYPSDAPEGVYILSTDGYLHKRSYWETSDNSNAVGVAVKTSACSFVIAPTEVTSIQWGSYDGTIPGCTVTIDESTAQTDYNGKANTDAIVATLGTTDFGKIYAASVCKSYTFKNGAKGYLGALGEWYQAYQNKSEIDACMSLIGGGALFDSGINNYWKWASTQFSADNAWELDWTDGNISYNIKNNNYSNVCARPFSAFPA